MYIARQIVHQVFWKWAGFQCKWSSDASPESRCEPAVSMRHFLTSLWPYQSDCFSCTLRPWCLLSRSGNALLSETRTVFFCSIFLETIILAAFSMRLFPAPCPINYKKSPILLFISKVNHTSKMAYASCHSASPGRALLLSTDACMYPHRAGECLACKY